ncbi:hypothetical protein NDU88_002505 [Pleurodeles waltl]|uniref:Uncharacterized protein n=1 Tax=Pleurodeles waltl TaxID=8319 RepID=A0AAV7VCQ7_PLEWA|nr:hypothetical protein NDU88_002505 [Pleurodeles waltl]
MLQAGPSCRTETDTGSSDPDELAASSNPLPLPGNREQGQVMRAFRWRIREDPTWTECVGASGGEKETRESTGGEHGIEGFTETSWHSEDLPEESEAWEAPRASPGHA